MLHRRLQAIQQSMKLKFEEIRNSYSHSGLKTLDG